MKVMVSRKHLNKPAGYRFSFSRRPNFTAVRSKNGSALIIALAFVVLLTGLIVAFFSRAMSERQVSNSSANETKIGFFTQGALDSIVGDLKQEIVDGSGTNAVMVTTGSSTVTLYYPSSAATAVPSISGFAPAYSSPGLSLIHI